MAWQIRNVELAQAACAHALIGAWDKVTNSDTLLLQAQCHVLYAETLIAEMEASELELNAEPDDDALTPRTLSWGTFVTRQSCSVDVYV